MTTILDKPKVAQARRIGRKVALDGVQRLVLDRIDWNAYLQMGEALRDRPRLRLTYAAGTLEIMTTSPEHDRIKYWIGRFVDVLVEALDLEYAAGGSMTFQREDLARGLEPDQCYWIANEPAVRGRLDYDPSFDPPPDLAIEIEVSRTVVDRMPIYAALGIPEVWRVNRSMLRVFVLQADAYVESPDSLSFPGIRGQELPQFFRPFPPRGLREVTRNVREWAEKQHASR